jgi:hypothetical protein
MIIPIPLDFNCHTYIFGIKETNINVLDENLLLIVGQ